MVPRILHHQVIRFGNSAGPASDAALDPAVAQGAGCGTKIGAMLTNTAIKIHGDPPPPDISAGLSPKLLSRFPFASIRVACFRIQRNTIANIQRTLRNVGSAVLLTPPSLQHRIRPYSIANRAGKRTACDFLYRELDGRQHRHWPGHYILRDIHYWPNIANHGHFQRPAGAA